MTYLALEQYRAACSSLPVCLGTSHTGPSWMRTRRKASTPSRPSHHTCPCCTPLKLPQKRRRSPWSWQRSPFWARRGFIMLNQRGLPQRTPRQVPRPAIGRAEAQCHDAGPICSASALLPAKALCQHGSRHRRACCWKAADLCGRTQQCGLHDQLLSQQC